MMPICPTINAGINECSARGWFSVSIVQRSLRFLTLSFVRIFSSFAHPVRWLSPPSVTQSVSGACARAIQTRQQQATSAREIRVFMVELLESLMLEWNAKGV